MTFLPNENSRASKVLDYVREQMTETGDLVTYEMLCDIIDLPLVGLDRRDIVSKLSGLIDEVNKRLHRDGDWRHLYNVVTQGYRIASAADIRQENLGRMRQSEATQTRALRAIEKAIRHPDATAAERRQAADVAANQGALLALSKKEHRKVRALWPKEEVSPVPHSPSDLDD